MNGKKQKRKIVDPSGFKCKTFKVSTSAEPFSTVMSTNAHFHYVCRTWYSWCSTLQNFDWKGAIMLLGRSFFFFSWGFRSALILRDTLLICRYFEALILWEVALIALGKEGPLGSTKYHLSLRWLQVFKSDCDFRNLVCNMFILKMV